jgi:hypothetical protein
MSVYKKLQEARVKLHNTKLNKSGKNAYAKFNYFELGDFIPQVTAIFNELGLCGIVSFTQDTAYLTVHNVEGENDFVTFTSPLVYASVEKTQPIQNLGSTHTYLRRYLWLMCMEITENDVVDAAEPKAPPKFEKAPNQATVGSVVVDVKQIKLKEPIQGATGQWQLSVADLSNLPAVVAAVEILLQLVKSEEDIKSIFQKNRNIFDAMKIEYPDDYADVLNKFKQAKDNLIKE